MNVHLQRAQLLIQQSRYDLAEEQLRLALIEESSCAEAHAMLAICLNEREVFAEATDEAKLAIADAPDSPVGYYALATVMRDRNRLSDARNAINEAIRLAPWDATLFSMLGSIEAKAGQWNQCLEAADNGLESDAEDVACANLRSLALTNLGRRHEAAQTIQETLRQAPEDDFTHANEGWRQLHLRNPHKAMEYFRESLRLNPMNEWAKQGIIEAMKARNFIYRAVLSFFLWMNGFSPRVQVVLILGFLFGQGVLSSILRTVPFLEPFGDAVTIAYAIFVWMTWSASTLFNLVLMTSPFGRLALAHRQKIEASLAGGCVLLFIAAAILLTVLNRSDSTFLWLALPNSLLFLGMTIPVVATFHSEGRRRMIAGLWTIGVFLIVLKCNYDAATLSPRCGWAFVNAFPATYRDTAESIAFSDEKHESIQKTIEVVMGADPAGENDRKKVYDRFSANVIAIIKEDVAWFTRGVYGIMLSTWLGLALKMIPMRR